MKNTSATPGTTPENYFRFGAATVEFDGNRLGQRGTVERHREQWRSIEKRAPVGAMGCLGSGVTSEQSWGQGDAFGGLGVEARSADGARREAPSSRAAVGGRSRRAKRGVSDSHGRHPLGKVFAPRNYSGDVEYCFRFADGDMTDFGNLSYCHSPRFSDRCTLWQCFSTMF